MAEHIYEKEMQKEKTEREFRLPNNRRQVGQPGGAEIEVFVEDYAFTLAKDLSEKDYTGCVVGVLVGECIRTTQGEKLLVEGVIEARDVIKRDEVCFTEENWTGIFRDIRDYFPRLQIVGWFLGGPGFLLEDEERQKKILVDNFGGGDKVFLKIDSIEGEEEFLILKNGRLECLPGYYIYYERNEGMQNYMMKTQQGERKERIEQKEPAGPYLKAAAGRPEVRTEMRRKEAAGSLPKLFYATGGVLCCLAVFVIGALAVRLNEREQLKKLLNEQDVSASSTRQVYTVKEGETIESICEKIYGDEELSGEIRLLNGLSAEENPTAGQKIFLP